MKGKSNPWMPYETREKAWADEKAAAYVRWREDKLARAADWLRKAIGHNDRQDRLARIAEKYGKAFSEDANKQSLESE